MGTQNKNLTKRPFLERVATFDLERYYTPWVRFLCHFSMWLVFTSLLQLNLFLDSDLPFDQAAAFAIRTLLCNIAVFYLFFYVAIPNTLLKNRIIPALLSFGACIIVWIILSHYFLLLISTYFNVRSPYYQQGLKSNREATIWFIISPGNIFTFLIPVFYSISPFFFTKIVFGIIRFYSKSFKSERKAVKLEVEKLNLERDFLKSQLNPHFLFNTLNNLYGLSLRKDEHAPEAITQLSEMMRYTLYESNTVLVTLKKELNYLENYVRLEKMRYKQDANIEYEINIEQVNGQMIAPLITFTFVENAFKYGLKKRSGGFVKIHISVADNLFYFSIKNDKQELKKKTKFGGIGLENVQRRLQLLYPDKHSLSIVEDGNTFSVALSINLA
jgi:sensor histidine kinase YesM